jgi:hypothetical protein
MLIQRVNFDVRATLRSAGHRAYATPRPTVQLPPLAPIRAADAIVSAGRHRSTGVELTRFGGHL